MVQAIVTGVSPWDLNVLKISGNKVEDPEVSKTIMQLALSSSQAAKVMVNCNRDTALIQSKTSLSAMLDSTGKQLSSIAWKKPYNIDQLMSGQEVIPVILQNQNGTIYYVANMNQEAVENTKRDGKLWVYSQTNSKLQQKGSTSGDFIDVHIDSFVYGATQDGRHMARVLVAPTTGSVCHETDVTTGKGYATCFFRAMPTAE